MQNEEINNSLNNSPQQEIQTNKKEAPVPWLKIFLLISVIFLVIFGTTLYLLGFFTDEQEEEVTITQEVGETELPQEKEDVTEIVETSDESSKFFYLKPKDANIFSYDVETEEKTKLTNNEFAANEIRGVFYINEGSIAFITEGYETPSSIYKIDLETKEIEKIKENSQGGTIYSAAFYDLDNFAYVEEDWQLILYQNGSEKILDPGRAGGRDIYFGDGSNISFSPNGKKLLYFNTISAINDETITIYNLEDNTKQKLSNGAHPTWLDDETIVFSALSEDHRMAEYSSDGIYKYDLNTKNKTKIEGISGNLGKPKICPERQEMLYISYPNEIWRYNFQTNESEKLLSKLDEEFWSVGWLDSERFFYKKVGESDEIILTVTGEPLYLSIYDLSQNTKIETPDFGRFHKWLPDVATKF